MSTFQIRGGFSTAIESLIYFINPSTNSGKTYLKLPEYDIVYLPDAEVCGKFKLPPNIVSHQQLMEFCHNQCTPSQKLVFMKSPLAKAF